MAVIRSIRIFISYRRTDSSKDAGRLHDRLVQAFSDENVFKDVDDIPPGSDFRGVIAEAVAECDVLLVLIGRHWLTATDEEGNRRLDNLGDFVRLEIETALRRDRCIVIPVLVDNAPMPRSADLPESLRELAYKNAVIIRDDPDFHRDVSRLIEALKEYSAPTALYARPGSQPSGPYQKPVPRVRSIWVIGAVVAVMVVIVGVLVVSAILGRNGDKPTEPTKTGAVSILTNTPTVEPTVKTPLAPTPEPTVATETPSPTPEPTETPKPTAPLHNTEWEPDVVSEFEGVEMVLVPSGCFMMGSDAPDANEDERPVHKVCFEEAFWIDRYEVTNAQFDRLRGVAEDKNTWRRPGQPRTDISWDEARDFCESRGAHLPTEAQWEYAARGTDSWVYPWGNEFVEDNVVYYGSADEPADVGESQRPGGVSWVGAYDMSGNVWEWVADWYGSDYYATFEEVVVNPPGPEDGDYRVLRGGSFDYFDLTLRAALRHWGTPDYRSGYYGFRCARLD